MYDKQVINPSTIKDLYDSDYLLWLEETSRLLQSKNFEKLDIENLIEEIESLGKSERNKLVSSL
jgi:hypothetical protein